MKKKNNIILMRYFSMEVNEDRHFKADMQGQYFPTVVNEDRQLKDIPGPGTHLITPSN